MTDIDRPAHTFPPLVGRPVVVHLTTTDMSLDWLLGPQLRAFIDAGYDVVGMSAPGSHVDELRAMGVRHVAVHSLTRAPSPLGDLRALRELYRLFRTERPLIVHTHNPKPGVLGRVAARLARVPIVVNTQHGLYAQPTDPPRRRLPVYALERFAAAFSHGELVQNEEDAHTLVHTLKVPADRITVLGNGIDLARFDPSAATVAAASDRLRAEWGVADGDVVCGVVGRLVWEKGIRELLTAAAVLRAAGGRARFVIIGPTEPDKPDALSADDIASATADGVVFAGQRTDMPECYSAMDVFVTATYREGFPRAAMEASAMGLPIVATDIRGCRQVVADGVTGTLVPARDSATLADAVARLVESADLRTRYGAAARSRALALFDQQRVIDITLATYARLRAR